jgi:hypothetical protein
MTTNLASGESPQRRPGTLEENVQRIARSEFEVGRFEKRGFFHGHPDCGMFPDAILDERGSGFLRADD